jgi:hypothetical protein
MNHKDSEPTELREVVLDGGLADFHEMSCQEDKSSPEALRRSACTNAFRFFAACLGLSLVVASLSGV